MAKFHHKCEMNESIIHTSGLHSIDTYLLKIAWTSYLFLTNPTDLKCLVFKSSYAFLVLNEMTFSILYRTSVHGCKVHANSAALSAAMFQGIKTAQHYRISTWIKKIYLHLKNVSRQYPGVCSLPIMLRKLLNVQMELKSF